MHPIFRPRSSLRRRKMARRGQPRPGLLHHPSPSQAASQPLQNSERRAHAGRAKPASLSPEASDKLRLQLLSELEELREPDALATWAHRVLPLKNQLSTADAQSVETAFAAKLSQLGDAPLAARVESPATNGRDGGWSEPGRTGDRVLTISKPVRERDRNHLRFVASQPCLVCGRGPSDAHHIKFAEQRAMGRKVSDKFTVPDLQAASSRAPSARRRTRLVGQAGNRSPSHCGSPLGENACCRFSRG